MLIYTATVPAGFLDVFAVTVSCVLMRCLSGTCLVLVIYRIVTARMSREMRGARPQSHFGASSCLNCTVVRRMYSVSFHSSCSRRPANVGCRRFDWLLIKSLAGRWTWQCSAGACLIIKFGSKRLARSNHSLELFLYAHSFHFENDMHCMISTSLFMSYSD